MEVRLTLDDIADQRAYERERESFRAEVIALKRLRRVSIGPIITVVFENRTTVRFQIQEMARAERLTSDAQIQVELDIYNPLVPRRGELSMTLFVELTSDEELRTWLPLLVGIERSVVLDLGEDADRETVRADVDPEHERQLTRDEITASVHYVKIRLEERQMARFATERAVLRLDHPSYHYENELTDETKHSLIADWE
jgi:hypothetical protein